MTPPSGQQFEIRHGNRRAVVVEVGAGLREYEAAGRPVLDGYAADEMASGGRGALLAPWPNRIRDGVYEFEGAKYQLALTEADKRHAIHGLVRWANWRAIEHSGSRLNMALDLHAQPGYPFVLSFRVTYELSDGGLQVQTTVRNTGPTPAPYGLGHHPYLKGFVDEALLRVPASSYLELDERLIPTGRALPVEGSSFDFRQPRRIGDLRMNTPYTDLTERSVRFGDISLWMDASYAYVMVFTGDTVQPASRRRRGLAVEPMTCAPDAFNNGLGLRALEPGTESTSVWGISR